MNKINFETLESRVYSPYSNKNSVCVVQSDKENCFPGVLVENISYPLTITSIQSALFSCIANSEKPSKVIISDTYKKEALFDWWVSYYDIEVIVDSNFEFIPVDLYEIHDDQVSILSRLKDLCETAKVENSDFPVSCLIQTPNGYIPGVNVELKSWELGLCAERVAISRSIAYGELLGEVIHIYAPKSDYVSPCGACRQVLFEHAEHSTTRLFQNEHEYMDVTVDQLLPYHFKSDSLKK